METIKELTTKDITIGMKIINRDHPEFGKFIVKKLYAKGIWEIRGQSGEIVLVDNELRFWREAE